MDSPQCLVHGDWCANKSDGHVSQSPASGPPAPASCPACSPIRNHNRVSARFHPGRAAVQPFPSSRILLLASISGSLGSRWVRKHERLRGRVSSLSALRRAPGVGGGGSSRGERAASGSRGRIAQGPRRRWRSQGLGGQRENQNLLPALVTLLWGKTHYLAK